MLDRIGYADALVAWEAPDGLELIDGHLRASTTPSDTVPVLVLDVNQQEADELLATLDPLSAMARTDDDALLPLLESLGIESQSVNAMLEALANGERAPLPVPPEEWPAVDATIETQHACPKCGYEWS